MRKNKKAQYSSDSSAGKHSEALGSTQTATRALKFTDKCFKMLEQKANPMLPPSVAM